MIAGLEGSAVVLAEADWGELTEGMLGAALAAEEESLLRSLGGDPVFGGGGGVGGVPAGGSSPDTSLLDDRVQDRDVVVAAALASGARQHGDAPGTLRRAAFSMNDLTAMVPSGRGAGGGGGQGSGPRGKSPPMQPVMEGQPSSGLDYHYHPRLPPGGYPMGPGYPPPQGYPHGGAPHPGVPHYPGPFGPDGGVGESPGQPGPAVGYPAYPTGSGGGGGGNGKSTKGASGKGGLCKGGVGKKTNGGMRRAASMGDLALAGRGPSVPQSKADSGSASADGPGVSGGASGQVRIGKLTIEERRQRILRYRQKRHERNFKKRIKYACRKTLADSRPRIRGRFATNEEWDALKKKKAEEDARKRSEGGTKK